MNIFYQMISFKKYFALVIIFNTYILSHTQVDSTNIVRFDNSVLQTNRGDIQIKNIKFHGCDITIPADRFVESIGDINYSNNELEFDLRLRKHCCINFDFELTHEKGKVNIKLNPSGRICDCMCNYFFTFSLKSTFKPAEITFNNTNIKYHKKGILETNEKFDILNGDTINYFDPVGRKQGLHVLINEKGDTLSYTDYFNNVPIEIKEYYTNGNIKSWMKRDSVSNGLHNLPYWKSTIRKYYSEEGIEE